MKILYSHRTRAADGQHVHIRELTNALRARGHEIIMAEPKGSGGDHSRGEGGLKRWLPRRLYELAELGYSLPAYQRLARLSSAHEPNVLYERYNLFFHAGAHLRKRNRLPMLLEVNAPLAEERAAHGRLALSGLARRSEQAIWRTADKVLPVSHVLAKHVADAGVPPEKVHVIHNGAGTAFLVDHDPAPVRAQFGLGDDLVLGFVGFVRAWHGLSRVVNFLAHYERKDVRLFIVGDGPVRADLERLAADLGVASRVTFAGVVQPETLPSHVAAFDVALQPAVVDYASPLKLFEYMAAGKPILAPGAENIREVLTDGEDAILFDCDDKRAFDKALAGLVENSALRQRLGGAARASVIRQGLTWDENARRVESVAEEILKDKR